MTPAHRRSRPPRPRRIATRALALVLRSTQLALAVLGVVAWLAP